MQGVSGEASTAHAQYDPFDGFGGEWGYQTDRETGLTLCGQRYYDATTARWLTRDPIGFGGGLNLYRYCMGNPIMGADPGGMQGVLPWINEHIVTPIE